MRLAVPLLLIATPAMAHNEVVMTASLVPLAGGLAVITLAAVAGLRQRFNQRRARPKAVKPRA